MKTIMLLEKRTYLLNTLKLFKQKQKVSIKELKQKIPSATYYRFLLPKILDINTAFQRNNLEYFIKPIFIRKDPKIITGLKLNPQLVVDIKDCFIELRTEEDSK